MPVMPDQWIKEMAQSRGMIEPFVDKQIRDGISYGLSSYGYDFRISNEFKVFNPADEEGVIDPKAWDHIHFKDVVADVCEIPPNGYVLAKTIEYFRIPRDVITICYGKSTYARCGVSVNVTPFEPEWEGYATIAISNTTPRPVRIYANEGIGQLIFLKAEGECLVSYADKKGKYQAQKEITVAKI
jgi:dCTP deaminase